MQEQYQGVSTVGSARSQQQRKTDEEQVAKILAALSHNIRQKQEHIKGISYNKNKSARPWRLRLNKKQLGWFSTRQQAKQALDAFKKSYAQSGDFVVASRKLKDDLSSKKRKFASTKGITYDDRYPSKWCARRGGICIGYFLTKEEAEKALKKFDDVYALLGDKKKALQKVKQAFPSKRPLRGGITYDDRYPIRPWRAKRGDTFIGSFATEEQARRALGSFDAAYAELGDKKQAVAKVRKLFEDDMYSHRMSKRR